jgi:hypothetical protein
MGKTADWQETDMGDKETPQSSSPRPYLESTVYLPNVGVQSAAVSAPTTEPNVPVTVTAVIGNTGMANGTKTVKVYVNGQEDIATGVAVNKGETRTMTFTVSRSQPGTYSVYVDGTPAGSFEVREAVSPDVILYGSLALIVLSLILAVIYVTRRRQYNY